VKSTAGDWMVRAPPKVAGAPGGSRDSSSSAGSEGGLGRLGATRFVMVSIGPGRSTTPGLSRLGAGRSRRASATGGSSGTTQPRGAGRLCSPLGAVSAPEEERTITGALQPGQRATNEGASADRDSNENWRPHAWQVTVMRGEKQR